MAAFYGFPSVKSSYLCIKSQQPKIIPVNTTKKQKVLLQFLKRIVAFL